MNFIELVGDTGTGSETSFDLNLGSEDIIGIGNLTSSDGEARTTAGVIFNGGNDNSRSADSADSLNNGNDDLLVIQTASNDVRINGSVRLE